MSHKAVAKLPLTCPAWWGKNINTKMTAVKLVTSAPLQFPGHFSTCIFYNLQKTIIFILEAILKRYLQNSRIARRNIMFIVNMNKFALADELCLQL